MYKTSSGWQFYKDRKAKHSDEKGRPAPAQSKAAKLARPKKPTKAQQAHVAAVHAMRKEWDAR